MKLPPPPPPPPQLNGHLVKLVPCLFCFFHLTLYETVISLRRTRSVYPKDVRLGGSCLCVVSPTDMPMAELFEADLR